MRDAVFFALLLVAIGGVAFSLGVAGLRAIGLVSQEHFGPLYVSGYGIFFVAMVAAAASMAV